MVFNAATELALSAAPFAVVAPGAGVGAPAGSSANSFGCCHEPRATAAVAPANASGLTTVWPCPNEAAAASTLDTFAGTVPVKALVPKFQEVPIPTEAPAFFNPSWSSFGASDANAVLHDFAKSTRNFTEPSS